VHQVGNQNIDSHKLLNISTNKWTQ